MNSYRDRPDAIRALVQEDRVHRDLYLSDELFALEQERFFANTWLYVGHASQVPNTGD
jgi:phenylpropionate dioxygenase-like ring-hydroxylating dioxygenase large terminal subunit